MDAKSNETHRLGSCTYFPLEQELRDGNAELIQLRSQTKEVLAILFRNSGRVVSKQKLFDEVWEGAVVTNDSLVQCVSEIRKALGDKEHRIIKTITKQGYKLEGELNPSADPPSDSPNARPRTRNRAGLWFLPAIVIGLFSIAAGGLWFIGNSQRFVENNGGVPSIAVLPFDDFSAGSDKGYLSDAIAEGIITELARDTIFEVMSRNSSFHFRDKNTDTMQIGEVLNVDYILEGSQQKSESKLKVTARLVEAKSGKSVWGHTYDVELGDIFVVQDKITKTVAHRIGSKIKRPVPGRDNEKVSALHFHLMGLAAMKKEFNADNNEVMFEMNRKAVDVDPDAHYGYLGLAMAYRHAATFGWNNLEKKESQQRGFENGLKALDLAPAVPDIHYVLARLHADSGEYEESISRFSKAIELNPSNSNYLAASVTPLLYVGHKDEAVEHLERAVGIDPFHPDWYHWQMGWAMWEKENCDSALVAMNRMNKIPKGAYRMLAGIHACLGNVDRAQKAYNEFYSDSEEPTISEQRDQWKDIWTAEGSLERWLNHMRIAGMKE